MLLIGLDYSIEEKISCANKIFNTYSEQLQNNKGLNLILKEYRRAIDNTWHIMNDTGICEICTKCAVEEGGSCCGDGIENKFDVVLLLINLFFGCSLPDAREIDNGCWFLGERGCKLIARQVICVNYLCKKIYKEVPLSKIHKLQDAILKETERLFIAEESLKKELLKLGI